MDRSEGCESRAKKRVEVVERSEGGNAKQRSPVETPSASGPLSMAPQLVDGVRTAAYKDGVRRRRPITS
jgi:hypothetical protein